MNWDEKAKGEAVETYFSAVPTAIQTRMVHPFIEGSRWQRDQLRTDEAVERVARAINPAAWDSATPSWDMRPSLRGDAHRAINALLGEEP